MKVVHVGYAHRVDDIRIFQKECLSLVKSGYEVIYVTSNLNYKSGEVPNSNVQVIQLELSKPTHRFSQMFYRKDLKRLLPSLDADVYHFHELSVLSLLLYMKRKGKKVIYDLHEDTPRQMQPYMYRRRGKIIGGLLVKFFEAYEDYYIKKADYIITATPHIAERCEKLAENVKCIANYPVIHSNGGTSIGKPFENALKAPILCYCGEVSEARNITMYVKMMERVKGKLFLAGPLEAAYKQYLENIKSWNKVEYLGYLDRTGVNHLYEKSAIGLCILKNTPNIYYSFPIKLFEYMEAGLPVICSDFPIWREIVEGNNCGVVVPCDDMEAAVKAVQKILMAPKLAAQMGENGKRAVREKYNWQTEEKKLIEIYHKLKNKD